MNQLRRKLLQGSASALLAPLLGTGLLVPGRVLAAEWNQNAFSARNANDALKAYGAAAAIESREITISAPEIAENGAKVEVDSAGTHGYHVGEAPDGRTQRAAAIRGYDLSQQRARKVAPQDLDYFDLILAMDKSNLDNLRRMASPEQQARIKLFMDYSSQFDDDEVPDPYYGLGHGFDLVLDMVEDASLGLVEEIQKKLASS